MCLLLSRPLLTASTAVSLIRFLINFLRTITPAEHLGWAEMSSIKIWIRPGSIYGLNLTCVAGHCQHQGFVTERRSETGLNEFSFSTNEIIRFGLIDQSQAGKMRFRSFLFVTNLDQVCHHPRDKLD